MTSRRGGGKMQPMVIQTRRRDDTLAWKILGYLLDVLVVALLAFSTWTAKQIYEIREAQVKTHAMLTEHGNTITAMKIAQCEIVANINQLREWRSEVQGNRFTAQDGKEVWMEISRVREAIAMIPSTLPPKWFVDRVDKIDARLEKIENRLTGME